MLPFLFWRLVSVRFPVDIGLVLHVRNFSGGGNIWWLLPVIHGNCQIVGRTNQIQNVVNLEQNPWKWSHDQQSTRVYFVNRWWAVSPWLVLTISTSYLRQSTSVIEAAKSVSFFLKSICERAILHLIYHWLHFSGSWIAGNSYQTFPLLLKGLGDYYRGWIVWKARIFWINLLCASICMFLFADWISVSSNGEGYSVTRKVITDLMVLAIFDQQSVATQPSLTRWWWNLVSRKLHHSTA